MNRYIITKSIEAKDIKEALKNEAKGEIEDVELDMAHDEEGGKYGYNVG